jgi:hypothetical protein
MPAAARRNAARSAARAIEIFAKPIGQFAARFDPLYETAMKTPLSISMVELSKIADAAAARADRTAREAGITPAGFAKRKRAGRDVGEALRPAHGGMKLAGKAGGR